MRARAGATGARDKGSCQQEERRSSERFDAHLQAEGRGTSASLAAQAKTRSGLFYGDDEGHVDPELVMS